MKNVLVGFYRVPNFGPDSVSTPLVGSPKQQLAKLDAAILAKHPRAGLSVRFGTVIEPEGNGAIEIVPGAVLANLFAETQTTRKIGRVWFAGGPFDIQLGFNRAHGAITVTLRGVLRDTGDIRFSNHISPQRAAEELPDLVNEVLGSDAREVKLNITYKRA